MVRAIQSLHSSFSLTEVDHYLLHAARNLELARPGARKEGFEKFVERLSRLEELAVGHKGVAEAVAFRAGDELMVLVRPAELGDADCLHLAHQLAREIREQIQPPNRGKVNVVRAVRSVAFAT